MAPRRSRIELHVHRRCLCDASSAFADIMSLSDLSADTGRMPHGDRRRVWEQLLPSCYLATPSFHSGRHISLPLEAGIKY